MMKKYSWLLLLLCVSLSAFAQDKKEHFNLYHPEADAEADINQALQSAKEQHKHVLLQIGGNWCIWCKYFHELVSHNDTLQQKMQDNYVVVYVNYDKDNKNDSIWEKLGYPQRFGFPVFVILNQEGQRLHTQNSAYLETGKGHSPEKVADFLDQWRPAAVAGKTIK